MNLSLSSEQKMLRDSAQKFLRAEYAFDARTKAGASEALALNRAHWQRFAEFGWLGLAWPEAYGGFDGGMADSIQVLEAMGEALVVEPYLACAVLAAQAIVTAGDAGQKAEWLPAIASGQQIATLAYTEADTRHELAWVALTARRSATGWVLSGRKTGVVAAAAADGFVVAARTAGQPGERDGIGLFLVRAGAPGVRVAGYRRYDGADAGDLVLDGVELDHGAALGDPAGGLATLERVIDLGIVGSCADALGAMTALLRKTGEYLRTRRQFDAPLASFQVLQHRLVDMFAAVEASRSLLLMAALQADQPDAAARARAASAAKVAIGAHARYVAQQAVQLHGGVGMTEELDVGHYFRRLMLFTHCFGGVDHHLQRFADLRTA